MAAVEAVQFLIDDHGDKGSGWREDFAKDKVYKSILQRQNKMLEEVLMMFDWMDDDAEWVGEYSQKYPNLEKLVKAKRKVNFCVCGWREFNEDFGRGDVSCLRDIRTPLVTSRTPLRVSKREFNG